MFLTLPAAHSDTPDVLSAIDRFEKCLRDAAGRLDDQISPASDIATSAAADCEPKWQSVLMASNEPLVKMEQYPSRSVRDSALRQVLEVRKERSTPPPTPPPKAPVQAAPKQRKLM